MSYDSVRRKLAAERPLLLLAPHLLWPAVNGADVTHVELAYSLSKLLPRVDLVGALEVVTYREGTEQNRTPYPNRLRSRAEAAARTLISASHYHREKFVTRGFRREARTRLRDPQYGAVLHSYLTTTTVAQLPDVRPHLVWSHNDEYRWFEDLRREARNPLSRAVAGSSLRWLDRYMEQHEHDLLLIHVTDADHAGWRSRRPQHRGQIVPIGASIRGRPVSPRPAGAPLRLIFVGALGIRMNFDALAHFAERFWPAFRERFGSEVAMTVVGSNPLREVSALCARLGWTLRPDVSEDELDMLYQDATFSVLPFDYATGAKLKLLASLARGVPVLATSAVSAQADMVRDPSLMEDDPAAWISHAEGVQNAGISADVRTALRMVAEAHSWDASARLLVAAISDV